MEIPFTHWKFRSISDGSKNRHCFVIITTGCSMNQVFGLKVYYIFAIQDCYSNIPKLSRYIFVRTSNLFNLLYIILIILFLYCFRINAFVGNKPVVQFDLSFNSRLIYLVIRNSPTPKTY